MTEDKAALVISHPGHELCVYGWLETVRPQVFVLTDGSGRSGISRLNSTTKTLALTGANCGSIYGKFTDLKIYEAILRSDFRLFEQIVTELAEALVEKDINYVAGDALEGYNPIHDTCRLIINAAVELARRICGRTIVNRDFLLFAPHDDYAEANRADDMVLMLSDELLARKLAMARAYSGLVGEVEAMLDKKMPAEFRPFPELSTEFNNVVLRKMGNEAYRVECLRLADNQTTHNAAFSDAPFYERYGERLVASGVYDQPIRYHEHMTPLAEAIRTFVAA